MATLTLFYLYFHILNIKIELSNLFSLFCECVCLGFVNILYIVCFVHSLIIFFIFLTLLSFLLLASSLFCEQGWIASQLACTHSKFMWFCIYVVRRICDCGIIILIWRLAVEWKRPPVGLVHTQQHGLGVSDASHINIHVCVYERKRDFKEKK